MTPQNPAQHAKIAADAVERPVRDVNSGRAQWTHPHTIRQATDDLTRLTGALATALQQMTAGLGQLQGSKAHPSVGALHLAGQSATSATTQLRQARRTMH
ncbi:hypothetical protein [Streptomyces sp. NPDC093109]|uniref:hypothetical protein n=1 Tax=Streptomyces sp. NPDC093109 TaxID=3154977 RepID=UPI00344C497D